MLRGCSMLPGAFTAQDTLWSFWQAVSAASLVCEGADHLLLLMESRGTSQLPSLEMGQTEVEGTWIMLKPALPKLTPINYIDIQLKRGLMGVWPDLWSTTICCWILFCISHLAWNNPFPQLLNQTYKWETNMKCYPTKWQSRCSHSSLVLGLCFWRQRT